MLGLHRRRMGEGAESKWQLPFSTLLDRDQYGLVDDDVSTTT